MTQPGELHRRGPTSAADCSRVAASRRIRRTAHAALLWVAASTLTSCGRPPRIVEAKGGYFAFGNVEVFRRGPDILAIESGITEVQYAVLVPLAAAFIAALASGYAWWRNRRARRRADWALPLGSALLAGLLAIVGTNATTVETVIDQGTRTVRVEQRLLWGTVPILSETKLDDVLDVQVVYRAGRGAYCTSMLRRRNGVPPEVPIFQFVDMLTNELDLVTCERLQSRIATALGDVPRAGPREED